MSGSEHADVPAVGAASTVLVVEDGTVTRETLAELLRDEGYEVLTAADGPTGWAALQRAQPRAALLDIGLPELDGYEIARRVRADHGLEGTALLAMTGHGGPEGRRKAEEAGFDAHLPKPVDIDEVLAALEQLGV